MLIFGINYQQYVNQELISEKPVSLKPMEFASGAELALNSKKKTVEKNVNRASKT